MKKILTAITAVTVMLLASCTTVKLPQGEYFFHKGSYRYISGKPDASSVPPISVKYNSPDSVKVVVTPKIDVIK